MIKVEGHPPVEPQTIILPQTCELEFCHFGFVVGAIFTFMLVPFKFAEDIRRQSGMELPAKAEDYIIATAQLFESRLADKAWEAIQRKIFSHVSPVVLSDPSGQWHMASISLTTNQAPGCPGARILRHWMN